MIRNWKNFNAINQLLNSFIAANKKVIASDKNKKN